MTESLSNSREYTERCAAFDEAFRAVKSEVASAEREAGIPDGSTLLLAATKTVPVEVINHAVRAGITAIGENRVQELKEKYPELDHSAEIHFIGHLQTNKVRELIPMVSMIHSVSSIRLAEKISAECVRAEKPMDILLEVNIGNEEAKSGFTPEELLGAVEAVSRFPMLSVKGLMAIPPVCEREEQIKPFFDKMYKLFVDIEGKKIDNVSMVYLSMGMSGDYVPAIRSGANIIRLGTALFGSRIYKNKES